MNRFIVFILAGMMASGALADGHSASGDASAGEVAFNKQCVACHVVVTDAGEKLAGRNSRCCTGLSLRKIFGEGGRGAGFDLDRRDVFGLCPRPKGFLKGVSRR